MNKIQLDDVMSQAATYCKSKTDAIEQAIDQVLAETSAPQLAAKINRVLQSTGFEIEARETTAGAIKSWLGRSGAFAMATLKNALVGAGIPCGLTISVFNVTEISGPGFHISHQDDEEDNPYGIFVAVHRRGPAGEEYAHGIDT